jgi:hypothetical protein
MSNLNKDVIFLILKELQDRNNTLYSCLLVNKAWCKTTVPILWKNPTKVLGRSYYRKDKARKILLNVILSHLSEESRDDLKNQGINLFMETHERPLFNYIRYWRYLDLYFLECLLNVLENFEKFKISLIKNEILYLFNINTKFGSLSVHELSSLITGSEDCFSELEYFYCNNKTSRKILKGLALTNKQIRKFELIIKCDDCEGENSNNSIEIVKLIEAQENLKEISFISKNFSVNAKSYCKALEEPLIKHADTIQYLRIDWGPITKFLSYLVNLISLDLTYMSYGHMYCDNLKNVSLPLLKFLKAKHFPSNILSSLIENTKGHLVEVSILYHYIFDDGRLIKGIYQNCSNLSHLKLSLLNENISEFENLLINCQCLNKLEVIGTNFFNWDELFKILIKSSPISLFKFTFTSSISYWKQKMKSLKLFLDNWKDRNSMSLHIVSLEEAYMKRQKQQQRKIQQDKQHQQILEDLLQGYRAIGIIKNYDIQISYGFRF